MGRYAKRLERLNIPEHDIREAAVFAARVALTTVIEQLLDKKNLNRARLAERLGVDRSRVTQMLNDEDADITFSSVVRMLHEVGVDVAHVLHEQASTNAETVSYYNWSMPVATPRAAAKVGACAAAQARGAGCSTIRHDGGGGGGPGLEEVGRPAPPPQGHVAVLPVAQVLPVGRPPLHRAQRSPHRGGLHLRHERGHAAARNGRPEVKIDDLNGLHVSVSTGTYDQFSNEIIKAGRVCFTRVNSAGEATLIRIDTSTEWYDRWTLGTARADQYASTFDENRTKYLARVGRWEYLQVANCSPEQLNEWGAEGWELVTAVLHGFSTVYTFKRPKA